MRLLIPTFMVTLSPTHPERTEAIRLWYAVRETLSPTRPERAEAHWSCYPFISFDKRFSEVSLLMQIYTLYIYEGKNDAKKNE